MKKVGFNLQKLCWWGAKLSVVGLTVTNTLGEMNVYAQSSIPNLDRDIIVRRPVPLPNPLKQSTVEVDKEDVQSQEEEFQNSLKMAVRYLEKNPKEISNYVHPKVFKKVSYLVKKGQFKEVAAMDQPVIKYPHGSGEKNKLMFHGDITNLLELGDSLKDSFDGENIKSVYEKAWRLIHPDRRSAFKSPKDVYKMKPAEARIYLAKVLHVVAKFTFIPYEPTSPGWKWDCEEEIGQQRVGTGDGALRCNSGDYHPNGLFDNVETSDFPLKYYNTCIKNQGRRGTCVSFAINAAVESALMVKKDKAYNFSEQFTYLYGEVYANHGGRYSYGLPTGKSIKKMDSKNVKFQYERYWEYNPSSQIGRKSGKTYPDSCNGYNGEMCNNYAFQGKESSSGFWPFKSWSYKVPYRGTSKNFQIVDTDNIWFSWAKSDSLDLAISLTKAKVPLVVSFNVKQNFMDAGRDGYVYYKSGEDQVGGHASVILGFIRNSKLPDGVSPAKERGFFIVKNSWGNGSGDCGYYYVDYKYFKKYAKGIYTVEVN